MAFHFGPIATGLRSAKTTPRPPPLIQEQGGAAQTLFEPSQSFTGDQIIGSEGQPVNEDMALLIRTPLEVTVRRVESTTGLGHADGLAQHGTVTLVRYSAAGHRIQQFPAGLTQPMELLYSGPFQQDVLPFSATYQTGSFTPGLQRLEVRNAIERARLTCIVHGVDEGQERMWSERTVPLPCVKEC